MQYFSNTLFADADTDPGTARYIIFGVPYDATTSFRPGTRMGPRAIREFSYNFETYCHEYDLDLAEVPVHDAGDIEPFSLPVDVIEQVRLAVEEIGALDRIPIMLGGEHSVTVGAVQVQKPDCYVVCDAHLDLRQEYGNTPYSHACVTRRILEVGVKDIVIIGARSGTREEFEAARDLDLDTADDVRRMGIGAVIEEVQEIIRGKSVYLSVDADVIDCCLTPGLGTPEPFGLTPSDVREVVGSLAPSATGFDYVEVCPVDAGQTAAVAARIIRDFIAVHWRSNNP
jgi:agmatinase